MINIFSPSLDVTLKTVTYNYLWENTGVGRYTSTCLSDCPWLLLIVIANDKAKGNCVCWNFKGILTSEGDWEKHGLGLGIYSQVYIEIRVAEFAWKLGFSVCKRIK